MRSAGWWRMTHTRLNDHGRRSPPITSHRVGQPMAGAAPTTPPHTASPVLCLSRPQQLHGAGRGVPQRARAVAPGLGLAARRAADKVRNGLERTARGGWFCPQIKGTLVSIPFTSWAAGSGCGYQRTRTQPTCNALLEPQSVQWYCPCPVLLPPRSFRSTLPTNRYRTFLLASTAAGRYGSFLRVLPDWLDRNAYVKWVRHVACSTGDSSSLPGLAGHQAAASSNCMSCTSATSCRGCRVSGHLKRAPLTRLAGTYTCPSERHRARTSSWQRSSGSRLVG